MTGNARNVYVCLPCVYIYIQRHHPHHCRRRHRPYALVQSVCSMLSCVTNDTISDRICLIHIPTLFDSISNNNNDQHRKKNVHTRNVNARSETSDTSCLCTQNSGPKKRHRVCVISFFFARAREVYQYICVCNTKNDIMNDLQWRRKRMNERKIDFFSLVLYLDVHECWWLWNAQNADLKRGNEIEVKKGSLRLSDFENFWICSTEPNAKHMKMKR